MVYTMGEIMFRVLDSYRKPYWRPCNFKLTAFKQTFQDDFLTEFDTLFTDKSLLRIFIFCPHTKKMKFLLPPANGTFAFAPTHKLTLPLDPKR